MNVYTASGNIGKDAETRTTQNGTAIASFTMAIKTGYGDRENVLWIKANIWGRKAEGGLVQYLVKGQQVCVSGELSESTWNDKEGNERKSLELNVREIDLIGAKKETRQEQVPVAQEPVVHGTGDSVPF